MKTSLGKVAIDRGALVNEALGRVLGVSSQGLVRSGRRLEEYTPAEWTSLLRTVTGGFARRSRSSASGTMSTATAGSPDAASMSEIVSPNQPIIAERLAVLGGLRRRLAPTLDLLRVRECYESACAEDVRNLVQEVELGFDDLASVIAEDFDTSNVLAYAGRLAARPAAAGPKWNPDAWTGSLVDLRKAVQDDADGTLDEESAAFSLASVAIDLVDLQDRIKSRDLITPLHEIREIIDECRRSVEEALSALDAEIDELGVLEKDLETIGFPGPPPGACLTLADRIAALRRDWTSVGELAGVGGGRQLKAAKRLAVETAERIRPVADLTAKQLRNALSLSEEEADELLPRLKRVARRALIAAARLSGRDASEPGGAGVPGIENFPAKRGVRLNDWVASDWQQLWGLGECAAIRIEGAHGEYQIEPSDEWTSAVGTVPPFARVRVRLKTGDSPKMPYATILSVDGASARFEVTTRSPSPPFPGDEEHDEEHTDWLEDEHRRAARPTARVEFDSQTVRGRPDQKFDVTISGGGFYRIKRRGADWQDWTQAAGTVVSGDRLQVRLTASKVFGEEVSTMLEVGPQRANFRVTTRPDPAVKQNAEQGGIDDGA